MLMQFVGKNSLGFEHGKIYECTIKKTKKWLELTTTSDLRCPYSSERALRNNWKLEELHGKSVIGEKVRE